MPSLPYNPTGVAVLAVSAVGIFVDFVVIGLRLWSRKLKRKRLDTGDILIITAWFLAFADVVRKIIAVKWGVGLHMWQILSTDPTHLLDAAAITFAGYFIWTACVTCIKMSILLVYRDLFYCITWFIRSVYAVMILCVLFFVGFMIGLCLQCTPFEANYNPSVPGAHCGISRTGGFYLIGSMNLFMDVLLVLLPIPVIWTLRISKLKKIGVCAMFALGIVIVVLVGYRFHLIRHQNTADFIHDGEYPGIFTSLELYLGIISACLPFLSPPLAKISSSFSESRLLSYIASAGSRSSRHRISNDGQSDMESLELEAGAAGRNKDVAKDPYNISVTPGHRNHDNEDDFCTVPSEWPREPSDATVLYERHQV